MTTTGKAADEVHRHNDMVMRRIGEAVSSLDFGHVSVVVKDGRVVQLERLEKMRLVDRRGRPVQGRHASRRPDPPAHVLEMIYEAVRAIRHGKADVIIQDGQVIQIDRVDKRRVTEWAVPKPLVENWSSVDAIPSPDWGSWEDQHGRARCVVGPGGNPGNALIPGGLGHLMQSGAFHRGFRTDFSAGLTMEADVRFSRADSHYSDVQFGLGTQEWQPDGPHPDNQRYAVRYGFNSDGGNRNLLFHVVHDDRGNAEVATIPHAFEAGRWYRAKFAVQPSGHASFYLDEELKWRSTSRVARSLNGGCVSLSGYRAGGEPYLDNLRVENEANP